MSIPPSEDHSLAENLLSPTTHTPISSNHPLTEPLPLPLPDLTRGTTNVSISHPPTPGPHDYSSTHLNGINASLRRWQLSNLEPGSRFEQISELIRAEIPGCLHLPDSPNKRFVAPGRAEKLLDRSYLAGLFEDVLGVDKSSQFVDLVEVFKLHPLILALIQLPWDRKTLEDLEAYYCQFIGEKELPAEAKLPLSHRTAQKIFGPSRGQRLLDTQFCYNAAILKVNQDLQDLPGSVRLPIIWESILGEGHDGKVWKARIPEGGWQKSDRKIRTGNKWIAIKVFSNEDYFKQELFIYHAIQKDAQHGSLTSYLGSLEHGTGHDRQCMIFLPLADCNLNTFLTTPGAHWGTNQHAVTLLRCAADLCGGLKFLHHHLDDSHGNNVSVIHGDIRPHNILVFFHEDKLYYDKKPLKITDYGFSKIKSQERGSNDTSPAFKNGTFLSPEAASGKRVTIVSDLWSLGAVLLEIVTYIVGGPDLVTDFRIFRTYKEDKVSYDRFFAGLGDNAHVNVRVTLWMEMLRTRATKKDQHLGEAVKHVLDRLEKNHLLVDEEERRKCQADAARQLLFEAASMLENLESGAQRAESQTPLAVKFDEAAREEITPKATAFTIDRPSTTETVNSLSTASGRPATTETAETFEELPAESEEPITSKAINVEATEIANSPMQPEQSPIPSTPKIASPDDKPLPPTPPGDQITNTRFGVFEALPPPADESPPVQQTRQAADLFVPSADTPGARSHKLKNRLKGRARKFGGWIKDKLGRSSSP
jgi:serine/threonine protein kinase